MLHVDTIISFGPPKVVERCLSRLLTRLLNDKGKPLRAQVLVDYLTAWCKCKHAPNLREVATQHLGKWLAQVRV